MYIEDDVDRTLEEKNIHTYVCMCLSIEYTHIHTHSIVCKSTIKFSSPQLDNNFLIEQKIEVRKRKQKKIYQNNKDILFLKCRCKLLEHCLKYKFLRQPA